MSTGIATVNLFWKEVPTGCYMDDVYDPDRDGTDPTLANGKYVLKEGSAPIIDREIEGAAYYVKHVDPVTFKHTFAPLRIIIPEEEDEVSIVSYGNDRFMLYYDDRTKPTKLIVDSKLFFVGPSLVEYRLYRELADGTREYISLYLDADEKFKGERIPMATAMERGDIKYCTNCHTLNKIQDGEVIILEIYNTVGVLSTKVSLVAMRADILNDLATDANPIVKFDIDCLQKRGEDFYIYAKQDPFQLNITPYVVYANGVRRDIPIDNLRCFLYGFEDYNPSYPGYRQPIMAKIFLSPREVATIGVDNGKSRYISAVRNLVTIQNNNTIYAKFSLIPYWDILTQSYKIRWFAYINTRDHFWDVTDLVRDDSETPFDGTKYTGQTQKLTVSMDLATLIGSDSTIIHSQNVWLTLYPQVDYMRYTFKDGVSDSHCYGVESALFRRPFIHYDETLTQYFIPTSIFRNKEAVLENFYYNARPMFNPISETAPPVPTHFNIRDMFGRMVISSPIEIEQYPQAWSIISTGLASQYVNGTLIVEWLKANGSGGYEIIYGVPVEVRRSTTGYNTETN